MKRLALAVMILAAGATAFSALRNSTAREQRAAAADRAAQAAQAQLTAQARSEHLELTERVRELKHTLAGSGGATPPATALEDLILQDGTPHLTADQSEQLLAELGFNWNSTSDYLIVSKDTLRQVRCEGMKKDRLSDTVCAVLAITPSERASLEAMTQQSSEQFKEWAVAHVQREEPKDDEVAKYTLPADAAFSQSLSNALVGQVNATLGAERSDLFLGYAGSWMNDLRMHGSEPAVLTVKRYLSGDETRLGFEIRHGGGTMSSDVRPGQPFPESFRPAFPGGWMDLANREGFELPKEFKK